MGGIHKFNQLGSFDQCTRTDFEVTFVHDHHDLRKDFPILTLSLRRCLSYETSFKWIGGHLIIQNCWTSQICKLGRILMHKVWV